MAKKPDIVIGSKYGRLTIIDMAGQNTSRSYLVLVRCDCDNELLVCFYNLVNGNTKSCGCLRIENSGPPRKDYTGVRFGRLVVTGNRERNNGVTYWECKCDCGNFTRVSINNLTSNRTRSCGCLYKEGGYHRNRRKDITGVVYGNLIALDATSTEVGVIWRCLCICGAYINVKSVNLFNGTVQSCGCVKKKGTTKHGLSRTKEFRAMYTRNRYEKKKEVDVEWTTGMESSIWELFSCCVVCFSENNLSLDHVSPLSKGYGLKPGNVVVLCRKCNSIKSAKALESLPKEWQEKILTASDDFLSYWNQKVDSLLV